MTSIWRVNAAHFVERAPVKNVNLASKVAEPCKSNEAALRVEGDEVPWVRAKFVGWFDTLVK